MIDLPANDLLRKAFEAGYTLAFKPTWAARQVRYPPFGGGNYATIGPPLSGNPNDAAKYYLHTSTLTSAGGIGRREFLKLAYDKYSPHAKDDFTLQTSDTAFVQPALVQNTPSITQYPAASPEIRTKTTMGQIQAEQTTRTIDISSGKNTVLGGATSISPWLLVGGLYLLTKVI